MTKICLLKLFISNIRTVKQSKSGADPGFPVGGGGGGGGGSEQPCWRRLTSNASIFAENVCKNERIGSHWGGGCQSIY